ncbi:MAG TPA: hypothetical protein PLE21_00535 [Giesbergeria sp.]|nr:hypothetical protein [Giesbergeria sp.]
MSKAKTLDLFAKLEAAPTYNSTVTVRSGRAMLKINTKNLAARARSLKNCHRKPAQKAVVRTYPKFSPGMSTAEYVLKFSAANGVSADVLPFDLSQYAAPCALYENGALDFDVIEEQIEESQELPQIDAIPESAEGAAPWADVLASSVESIGAMEEGAFSLMVGAFEDINYHSESLMVRCLRAGREDLASAVAHLLRLQNSPEYRGLNGAQCDARAAVSAMLAGESVAHISDAAASILASWGLVIRKPQASEAFAAMIRAAREAKRIARKAIAQASASSAQSVPDDADGNPYPYLQPISDTHSGGVAAAKNIRLVLKNQFPGVKFKVTSDYSSVNVRWIDGPTCGAVDDALSPFDIGHSDSQSDYFYTERTRFSEQFGGVQYLFTHRELSESKITASLNAVFGEDGPTLAEWKAGTPWAQVARKGSYRDAQMWDQYEWLSMVRRHANEK